MQQLELKESFGAEAIETACAFANAHGGFIVIGVDNNGHLANKPLRGESLRDYENRIATSTEPSVADDADEVAKKSEEVAKKVAKKLDAAESAQAAAESKQTGLESAKRGPESAQAESGSAKSKQKRMTI